MNRMYSYNQVAPLENVDSGMRRNDDVKTIYP
jgi:hypothetical protein